MVILHLLGLVLLVVGLDALPIRLAHKLAIYAGVVLIVAAQT